MVNNSGTRPWVCGGRISDILGITENNINFKDKTIRFLVRKRKDNTVADKKYWLTLSVDMETLSEIMDYIHTWNVKGYLFQSYRNSNKPLSRQAVALKLKSLSEI
jgi:integrase